MSVNGFVALIEECLSDEEYWHMVVGFTSNSWRGEHTYAMLTPKELSNEHPRIFIAMMDTFNNRDATIKLSNRVYNVYFDRGWMQWRFKCSDYKHDFTIDTTYKRVRR